MKAKVLTFFSLLVCFYLNLCLASGAEKHKKPLESNSAFQERAEKTGALSTIAGGEGKGAKVAQKQREKRPKAEGLKPKGSRRKEALPARRAPLLVFSLFGRSPFSRILQGLGSLLALLGLLAFAVFFGLEKISARKPDLPLPQKFPFWGLVVPLTIVSIFLNGWSWHQDNGGQGVYAALCLFLVQLCLCLFWRAGAVASRSRAITSLAASSLAITFLFPLAALEDTFEGKPMAAFPLMGAAINGLAFLLCLGCFSPLFFAALRERKRVLAARPKLVEAEAPSGWLPETKKTTLVGIQGVFAGKVFEVSLPEATIGREAGNSILLAEDPTVSRRHAKISQEGDKFTIEDLGSSNGTFVNGVRIQSQILMAGDRIRIGQSEFRFEVAG